MQYAVYSSVQQYTVCSMQYNIYATYNIYAVQIVPVTRVISIPMEIIIVIILINKYLELYVKVTNKQTISN